MTLANARELIRDIRDFPKAGIVFKDITPVLADARALAVVCDELARPYRDERVDKVLAIESRGFFFGMGIAERLGVGLVPVRKAGKLPWETVRESYQLEYGEAVLEIHRDAVREGERVVIADDVLATGGTLRAACALAHKLGGSVVGAALLLEIAALKGRSALEPMPIHSVWSV